MSEKSCDGCLSLFHLLLPTKTYATYFLITQETMTIGILKVTYTRRHLHICLFPKIISKSTFNFPLENWPETKEQLSTCTFVQRFCSYTPPPPHSLVGKPTFHVIRFWLFKSPNKTKSNAILQLFNIFYRIF